jgi:hypothetical protein
MFPPVEQPISHTETQTFTKNLEKSAEQTLVSKKRKSGLLNASSVKKWGFGEGHEGSFVQPTASSDSALIIGRSVPWWGMVVAHIDLRIHSILLNGLRFPPLVSTYFGSDISMKKNVDQSSDDVLETHRALRECSVVAMGSLPKPNSVLNEMWVGSKVRFVFVAHRVLYPPPYGWKLYRNKLSRSKVAGVANATGNFGIYYQSPHVNLEAILGKST